MAHSTLADRPQARALAMNGGTPVAQQKIQVVCVRIADEDIDAAVEVMRSGMLAQGKNVMAFEEEFTALSGATHAAACSNGTCALQLAYGPLLKPGDEVLCPAWSYIATASMIVAAGAIPVWVDADPVTYGIDAADARAKVTDRTTAIAATHIYGNPVDIDAVETLAIDKGLAVIYDAAQAHLAQYRGTGIGAFGDFVTYSFYPTKNMTTGEGGMVTSTDDELMHKVRMLRSHGESAKYEHSAIGFNYRMTDVEAAMGRKQLQRLPQATAQRRANAQKLDALLADIDGLHAPTATEGADHAYHLYAVGIDEDAFVAPPEGKTVRDLFIEAMGAEGVATAVHYPRSLTRQPVFDVPGVRHCEVSDRLARTLMCVPVHQELTDDDITRVGEALNKVATAYRA